MSRSLFISLLIATTTATSPPRLNPDTFTPGAPGFADCPEGILCPILPRQEAPVAAAPTTEIVTVTNSDCESEHASSATLAEKIVPTAILTVYSCPPEVTDCPASSSATAAAAKSSVTVCPPEGCGKAPVAPTTVSPPPPAATRIGICPVEECPECRPENCTPCPIDGPCMVCDTCPPKCPTYCPPPGVTSSTAKSIVATPSILTPVYSPNPTFSSSRTAAIPSSASPSAPVAAGEKTRPATGVYLGMAAVFVAVNWF